MGADHFCVVAHELTAWIADKYLRESEDPCPAIHEALIDGFRSLILHMAYLLEGCTPTDHVQEETRCVVKVFDLDKVDSYHVVKR